MDCASYSSSLLFNNTVKRDLREPYLQIVNSHLNQSQKKTKTKSEILKFQLSGPEAFSPATLLKRDSNVGVFL